MKEILRGPSHEILDNEGENLELVAQYGVAGLKRATHERTNAEGSAEQAKLKEDDMESRSIRHYRENRGAYEQAAADEDARKPEERRMAAHQQELMEQRETEQK